MKKTNAIALRPAANVPAATLPLVPSRKMVASVFAELPPTLPSGVSERTWLTDASDFIGEHPDPVLVSAREAILSKFAFAPKKAEIISELLAAYVRLGVALSEDAKRHLSYRKKMPARYSLNDAGQKRFADDAKVVTVGFVVVQGPQGNLILDDMTGATVEDVEKAVPGVLKAFSGAERVGGDDVLERLRIEIAVQVAYRIHGTPEEICGGRVAEVGGRSRMHRLVSTWVALSEAFVNRMHQHYPHARAGTDTAYWGEAMREAFQAVAHTVDTAAYGDGLQATAEAAIEARMADLNRAGRDAILTSRKFAARQVDTVLTQISTAHGRLVAGEEVGDSVFVGDEVASLRTIAACEVARAKAEALKSKISGEIKQLQGAA